MPADLEVGVAAGTRFGHTHTHTSPPKDLACTWYSGPHRGKRSGRKIGRRGGRVQTQGGGKYR